MSLILFLTNLSSAFADNSNFNQSPKNLDIIKSKGVSEDSINKLGSSINLVSSLIQSQNLSNIQVTNLIKGLLTTSKQPTYKTPYQCNATLTPINDILTGPHYLIQSEPGYTQTAGFVTLPSVSLKNSNFSAFETLGFYSSITGCDMGLYSKGDGKWYLCSNLGGPYWQGNSIWSENNTPITNSKVYIVASCLDNALEIKVFDPQKMTLLDSLYVNAPNRGFSKNGSDIVATREHALAVPYGCLALNDGSYMHGSKWENVTIGNDADTAPWGTAETDKSETGLKDTVTEQKCITIDQKFSIPYTQDLVDIDFR